VAGGPVSFIQGGLLVTLQLDTNATRVDEAVASRWSRRQWRDRAACRGMSTVPADDVFFTPDSTQGVGEERTEAWAREATAKPVCARCPVRAECLGFALATGRRFGVWGGLSEAELDPLRRARRATGGTAVGTGVDQ
jgi:WhiB family redox-sensing transcriptional regulator